ncbi:MAG TPA: methionyl-tRNA formyltransferase [Verrucomicrobiae bacterium]|nr:methionyl-tRNA formyltransferase [Verrucomicrobiae bacterium]
MGTPQLACDSLQALADAPAVEVVGVVTQPDRPKGRELKLTPSPVKQLALERQLPVLQPEKARDPQFLDALRELRPDLICVAAFGQILPPSVLELPRFGCLNVHTSLLPKYRGAAPIQWAILNGDTETGVTIMKMDPGLDTGPILAQESTPILEQDNSQSLHDRLAALGAQLLIRTIPPYLEGQLAPSPQPAAGASYARKIVRPDGLMDWRRSARELWNQIRGLVPWPGAFTYLPAPMGGLLKIWAADMVQSAGPPGAILRSDGSGLVVGCGQGALRLLLLQREGGRRLTPQQFLAGCPLRAGQRLGDRTPEQPPT